MAAKAFSWFRSDWPDVHLPRRGRNFTHNIPHSFAKHSAR